MALRKRKMCLKCYGYFDNDMLILAMVGELAGIASQTQSETYRRFSVYARAPHVRSVRFKSLIQCIAPFYCTRALWTASKPARSANQCIIVKVLFFQGNFILYLAIKGLKLQLINY